MIKEIDKLNSDIRISHFVGLSGVGGVQKNFSEYIKLEITNGNSRKHKVYTIGKVDKQYQFDIKILNILKIKNLVLLMLDLISKNKIVHFYNNLTSLKVAFFLFFIPTKNLIAHERGAAWNLPSKYGFILRFIALKSNLILANSKATKILLNRKFGISEDKVKVLHNGINVSSNCNKNLFKKTENFFFIGFIGRLDTPKGVHVLIDAINNLKNENIKLIIAGDGPLMSILTDKVDKVDKVQFVGRISDVYAFFNKIDLLIVPSIREPLGNVCIEAGLCKVPVLASYVDGIPEIITNNFNGELIKPKKPVLFIHGRNYLPLPEYVVNPDNYELISPMQVDSIELADKILELSSSPKKLLKYADESYRNIVANFSIESYTEKLNNIYLELIKLK